MTSYRYSSSPNNYWESSSLANAVNWPITTEAQTGVGLIFHGGGGRFNTSNPFWPTTPEEVAQNAGLGGAELFKGRHVQSVRTSHLLDPAHTITHTERPHRTEGYQGNWTGFIDQPWASDNRRSHFVNNSYELGMNWDRILHKYHNGRFNYLMADGRVEGLNINAVSGMTANLGAALPENQNPTQMRGMWTIKASD
jgi:prepilin-type processing-associated H-X9-DG protein